MRNDFPNTSLTLFQRIQGNSPNETNQALNDFFSIYWLPLYSFLRASGEKHEDASDYLQGFIARELLDRDQLRSWTPSKGKLRGYLKVCLDRFRKNQKRYETVGKRGGKRDLTHISIDFDWADSYFESKSTSGESPDKSFDREWASALVSQATSRLAAIYSEKGKGDEFRLLLENLERRGEEQNTASYDKVASELGTSVDAVKQRMRKFRAGFNQCLRQTVRDFVDDNEVEDEVEYLLALLGQ